MRKMERERKKERNLKGNQGGRKWRRRWERRRRSEGGDKEAKTNSEKEETRKRAKWWNLRGEEATAATVSSSSKTSCDHIFLLFLHKRRAAVNLIISPAEFQFTAVTRCNSAISTPPVAAAPPARLIFLAEEFVFTEMRPGGVSL